MSALTNPVAEAWIDTVCGLHNETIEAERAWVPRFLQSYAALYGIYMKPSDYRDYLVHTHQYWTF